MPIKTCQINFEMKTSKFGKFRRVVIKVGSALLVDKHGDFNNIWLDNLSSEIALLKKSGTEILIVSSGAVAIGCNILKKSKSQMSLNEMQASAAMGQAQLVMEWQDSFKSKNINVAQILLTRADTENKKRFLNSKDTLSSLLDYGVIPVINENDTVATDELKFGDNDRLAARVAQMAMADLLILLSDVDGLYDSDPKKNMNALHIPTIDKISDEIINMAGKNTSNYGSGGMVTKLQAAKIATQAGCSTIISNGAHERPLSSIIQGEKCSYFSVDSNSILTRKQWLAGYLDVSGSFKIDHGAQRALYKGGSLLPVGLMDVEGDFERGDVIRIMNDDKQEIGRGLTAYSSEEAEKIKGCQSDNIIKKLGYKNKSELIHRDNMALFQSKV